MADVAYSAVASDDNMRGRDPQMEGDAQAAVVESDRHGDRQLLAIAPGCLEGIVDSRVGVEAGMFGARRFVDVLKMRHLLPARHAPGCPKLQVHGLLAVKTAEIDCIAVDRLEHQSRRR